MEPRAHRAMDTKLEDETEAVDQTLFFWQPRTSRCLNVEDARQMIENIAGFFSQLDAWDSDCRSVEESTKGKPYVTDISAIAHESNGQKLGQEYSDCNPANNSLAA